MKRERLPRARSCSCSNHAPGSAGLPAHARRRPARSGIDRHMHNAPRPDSATRTGSNRAKPSSPVLRMSPRGKIVTRPRVFDPDRRSSSRQQSQRQQREPHAEATAYFQWWRALRNAAGECAPFPHAPKRLSANGRRSVPIRGAGQFERLIARTSSSVNAA